MKDSILLPPPKIIFVRSQAKGNVGAMARVMSNFDCWDLRLVCEPEGSDYHELQESNIDWAFACKGKEIIQNAQIFSGLSEALADCHLAVATTVRTRVSFSGYTREVLSVEESLKKLVKEGAVHKSSDFNWALVIGSERTGLSDDEWALCDWGLSIPTSQRNSSMNAAMALGCMLYHWSFFSKSLRLENQETVKNLERSTLCAHGDKESFVSYLMETLADTDFFKYPDQEAVRARFRRWLQGAKIPRGELLFAFEALYHVRAKIRKCFEKRNFLSSKIKEKNY